jgi:hypothetical protein
MKPTNYVIIVLYAVLSYDNDEYYTIYNRVNKVEWLPFDSFPTLGLSFSSLLGLIYVPLGSLI